jgi:superfamily II DNA/RNA helicase
MKLEMCGKKAIFVSKGLTTVANFLEHNPDCSVVIFCNSRHQSLHIASQLEKKLDMKKLAIDVLNINGSLNKTDKFWRIRLFCDNRHSRRGQFRALVTTNASNVGIDKHSISLQVRLNGAAIFKHTSKREDVVRDLKACDQPAYYMLTLRPIFT